MCVGAVFLFSSEGFLRVGHVLLLAVLGCSGPRLFLAVRPLQWSRQAIRTARSGQGWAGLGWAGGKHLLTAGQHRKESFASELAAG